jgi:hypothetical protein
VLDSTSAEQEASTEPKGLRVTQGSCTCTPQLTACCCCSLCLYICVFVCVCVCFCVYCVNTTKRAVRSSGQLHAHSTAGHHLLQQPMRACVVMNVCVCACVCEYTCECARKRPCATRLPYCCYAVIHLRTIVFYGSLFWTNVLNHCFEPLSRHLYKSKNTDALNNGCLLHFHSTQLLSSSPPSFLIDWD